MDDIKTIETPIDDNIIKDLRVGDRVLLSGTIYTARDKAHMRLVAMIEEGQPLPFSLEGQIIYYVGPTPNPPGMPIGAAGPTTSSRLDPYTPILLSNGLKGMIGKGKRRKEVVEAIKKYKAVYFVTLGGAGALLSQYVLRSRILAFPEYATEAIYELEVEDFPMFVANDIYGDDLYESRYKIYQVMSS
ncbi:MAG: FumA C-terminus/TtdB family hydratase beta subunit [Spirochaetota bacterium]|nr:FumA C-terminus/TtdB family hydratase beta subunit [Spirochaetota bacterium]